MILHSLRESAAPFIAFFGGTSIVVADQVGTVGGSDFTIIGVLVGVLGAVWKLLNVIGSRMAKSIEDNSAQVRELVVELRATNERHARTTDEIVHKLDTIEQNTRKSA